MDATAICSVCTEEFDEAPVVCGSCTFEACPSCIRRYHLTITDDAPNCMGCRVRWSQDVFRDAVTSDFVFGAYRDHVDQLHFHRENALMPETMPFVQRFGKIVRDLCRDGGILHERLALARTSTATFNHLLQDPFTPPDEKVGLHLLIIDLETERFGLKLHINFINSRLKEYHAKVLTSDDTVVDNVRICPTSGCRGYLNNLFTCSLCDVQVCNRCLEIVDNLPHHCDVDNVATQTLLALDTKACPSCHSAISKIDGCDQMFCVRCHTTFSWTSCRIDGGRIHNPHYHEHLRQSALLDRVAIRCGPWEGMPPLLIIMRKEIDVTLSTVFSSMFQLVLRINTIDIPAHTHHPRPFGNRDLRFSYLVDRFDKISFINAVRERRTVLMKDNDLVQVLLMFVASVTDIIIRFTDSDTLFREQGDALEAEVMALQLYGHAQIRLINDRYNCIIPENILSAPILTDDNN